MRRSCLALTTSNLLHRGPLPWNGTLFRHFSGRPPLASIVKAPEASSVLPGVHVLRIGFGAGRMLNKDSVDKELARRLCADFVSYQLGVTVAMQYKNTPEDVGDLWYCLASLARELVSEGQHARYPDMARMATSIIQ
jgi:hypothetical protein